MRERAEATAWVVYETAATHSKGPGRAVCSQEEWDAMELDNPGGLKLIQSGITNEGQAEALARGTAGDDRRTGWPGRGRAAPR
jgi:hypothetical protein